MLGFVLDLGLDTRPVFMIALTLFASAGMGVRTYYAYTDKMKKLEEARRASVTEGRR
jgi:F0F1-type ATP synthase assembly protein I